MTHQVGAGLHAEIQLIHLPLQQEPSLVMTQFSLSTCPYSIFMQLIQLLQLTQQINKSKRYYKQSIPISPDTLVG